MANYFQIPETSQIVYEGDLVTLSEHPGYLYTATYGWYTASGVKQKGWYFMPQTGKKIVPIDDTDLSELVVVDSKYPRPCPPGPYPPGPFPPGPFPPGPCPPGPPIPPIPGILESRAAVTVQDIAQRNVLASKNLPGGKIVRVNDDGTGQVAYYEWDAEALNWVPLNWGSGNVASIDSFAEDLIITQDQSATSELNDTTIVTSGAAGAIAEAAAEAAVEEAMEWEEIS